MFCGGYFLIGQTKNDILIKAVSLFFVKNIHLILFYIFDRIKESSSKTRKSRLWICALFLFTFIFYIFPEFLCD